MHTISSRKNPVVKEAADLAMRAAVRRETGLFLCEGARLCEDAARSGVEILRFFLTAGAHEKYRAYTEALLAACNEGYFIEPHVAELLSQTKNTQGVFCVCRQVDQGPAPYDEKSLVLENIQDPANLGAVMRTAEALGLPSIILTGASCDLYSPKALRASMGAVFRLPVYVTEDVTAVFAGFRDKGTPTYAALPDREALRLGSFRFPESCAVFVGNEGAGLSEAAIQGCDHRLTIPMGGRAESLNAAAAAAVIIWEMQKEGVRNDG